MNWYKAAQGRFTYNNQIMTALDYLHDGFSHMFSDFGQWHTVVLRPLMPGGTAPLGYGLWEEYGKNVKMEGDQYQVKVFCEIKNNTRMYFRGFVRGYRPTPWPSDENVNTLRELYGPEIGQLMPKKMLDWSELVNFEQIITPDEVLSLIQKAINGGWDGDFEDDFPIVPIAPEAVGIAP